MSVYVYFELLFVVGTIMFVSRKVRFANFIKSPAINSGF